MTSSDIANLKARELTSAYRAGTLSPVEVADAMLKRIEDIDPKINAFHHVDAECVRTAAKASEERWRQGAPLGPVDGVPTAIKDGLMMKGVPIYRGSLANGADKVESWDVDAPCVERLQEGGAIILGKTTMCDYGMLASGYSSKFGPTRNPRDVTANPGGSSSGSSAAVAAGIGPFTIGTDIVGSIRNPASFCGLFGHKPSYGRVPFHPQNSPSVVAGPIARDVRDAALLMNILSQPDSRDVTALQPDGTDYLAVLDGAGVKGRRVGLMYEIGFGPAVDPEVRDLIGAAARQFEALGAHVEEVAAPFTAEDIKASERFYQIRALTELEALDPERQKQAEVIYNWTMPARGYTGPDHYRDFLGTQDLRARFLNASEGFDFILMPTVPIPPYAAENPGLDDGDIFAPWCNTFVMNLTQQPASSVPCGTTKGGLPVGLQIIGRRFDDVGVFQASAAIEAALDLPTDIATP